MTVQKSKAFAVNFRDTKFWNPNSFFSIGWKWSQEYIKPLSYALKRKSEEVNRKLNSFETLNLVTLHFDGTMESRNLRGKSNFKGKLFFANAGDVIYSKIDVRNGAIGVVPENFSSVAVSAEYPVYEVREGVASAEYIRLLFRTVYFRQVINSMISGASGRKRVQPAQLEKIDVPLPSLETQKQIVYAWQQAQINTANAEKRVKKIEQDMENLMLNSLGISLPSDFPEQKIFPIFWKDLERWDLFFQRPDFVALENQLHTLHALSLGEVLNFESRSWKKSDFPEGKFEYIEISSVNRENGIFSSRTVETNNAPSRATTLVKTGDLIISTTRPYLGAIAIVPEKYNNYVCSSGFALATSTKLPNVDIRYVLFFLTSKAGLLQLERRMTGGLYPAIVQEELEKVKIPIPSSEVQKEIMRRVEEGRSKIRQEQEAAAKVAEESESEVERMILGLSKA